MKQNQLQKFPKIKCSYRLIPSICRERKEKLIKSTEEPTHNDENILSWGKEFSSHRNPQFVTHHNVKVFLKQATKKIVKFCQNND